MVAKETETSRLTKEEVYLLQMILNESCSANPHSIVIEIHEKIEANLSK